MGSPASTVRASGARRRLVRGGIVVDGTGGPRHAADVVGSGERVEGGVAPVVMQAGAIVVRNGVWQGRRAGARLIPGRP